MFGVGCFWLWLETTIIIKIEPHSFYPIICAWFRWGWSKNLEIFAKKYWELSVLKISVLLSWPFWIIFFDNYFFCFIPIKIRQKLWDRMDATQFLWLLGFPSKNNPPQTFLGRVYIILIFNDISDSSFVKKDLVQFWLFQLHEQFYISNCRIFRYF